MYIVDILDNAMRFPIEFFVVCASVGTLIGLFISIK